MRGVVREFGANVNIANAVPDIMAQGSAFAELAFMDRFEVDIIEATETGARVSVDPPVGLVIVGCRGQENYRCLSGRDSSLH